MGRPFLTVLLTVAVVVLVALAATGERVPLATEGSGGRTVEPRSGGIVDTEPARRIDDRADPSSGTADSSGAGVVSVLVQTVLILGCVILVALVVQALVRLWRRAPAPDDEPPEEHWPRQAPATMAAAVDEGLSALRSGPTDEVIVACWVRLEDAAAAAGVARGVGETPAELASRVLADLHAPSRAVGELLARYRLARYSRHALDEDDRTVAIRSLEQVRQAIAGAHG